MTLKEASAVMDGTVAKPSNPSVRLTAFDVEMITKIHKARAKNPMSNTGDFKNGTYRSVLKSAKKYKYPEIAMAAII